jgi:hypothetical protein
MVDVDGIVYVNAFTVELSDEQPCVKVSVVPEVLVTHISTTLPTVKLAKLTVNPAEVLVRTTELFAKLIVIAV